MSFSRLLSWSLFVVLTLPAFGAAPALVIDGITDRQTYTDSVAFRVQTNAGFTYTVLLNGQPKPAGITNVINRMDYYDLFVERIETANSSSTIATRRFVVVSSERGDPERGLIKWTPYPSIDSTAAEFAGARLNIIAPHTFPRGLDIPVIAWLNDDQDRERRVNGWISAPGFSSSRFRLRRGHGFGFLPAATNGGVLEYAAQVHSLVTNKQIAIEPTTTWTPVSGMLNGTTVWPAGSRIQVLGSITVPAGSTLTIGEGTIVRLNPAVDITNSGRILINGTTARPVVLTATNQVAPERHAGAWGGFLLRGPSAELVANGAIMTGSGAQPEFDFTPGASHRDEQALLLLHGGSRAYLTNCYLINNAGQIGNGDHSDLTLDHCLVQRAITAGEYEGGTVIVNHSAVIEFPAETGEVNATIASDDYDGLYFTLGTHILLNSLIGFCKDDAIDSGSGGAGTVLLSNCWVEAALHEALAWSGGNRQTWTYDTVLMNSGTGIEAGWSQDGGTTPNVFADRLLSTGNSVGARFGDNYDWNYYGFLRTTNAYLLYNYRDIFAKTFNTTGSGWDTNQWVDRRGQMDLRGSYASQVHTNFPEATLWNPLNDGYRLTNFTTTPPGSPVGIGFALWEPQLTLADLTNGVPVRLSSFSSEPVSVDYTLADKTGVLTSGSLSFPAGQTVQHIFANPGAVLNGELLRLQLSNPVGAEVTGSAEKYSLPSELTPLVPFGSSWKYLDNGTDQGTAWRALAFNDTGWSNGLAELGVGESDQKTTMRRTINGTTTITFYFRKVINVPDPTAFGPLVLRLRRDDGGVVYINDQEVFRVNLPAGAINYTTRAPETGENDVDTTNVVATVLQPGNNIIAVEIHQESTTSSDVSFDLELVANPAPILRVRRFADELVLYWTRSDFLLEEAGEVSGPWTAVEDVAGALTVAPASDVQHFYRLRQR